MRFCDRPVKHFRVTKDRGSGYQTPIVPIVRPRKDGWRGIEDVCKP